MTETMLPDAETAAALLLLRKRIQETSDPIDLAGYLTQVGEFILSRLGFDMDQRADVQIDIGTDEHPEEVRITLAWPLPPLSEEADR